MSKCVRYVQSEDCPYAFRDPWSLAQSPIGHDVLGILESVVASSRADPLGSIPYLGPNSALRVHIDTKKAKEERKVAITPDSPITENSFVAILGSDGVLP